jgi:hypothetical protein
MMENVIELKEGGIYFRVTFFDKNLSVPSIETYIYDGENEYEQNEVLFINAEGYVAAKEGIENIETYYISYPKDNIFNIVDKERLFEWLKHEHSPKLVGKHYEYIFL